MAKTSFSPLCKRRVITAATACFCISISSSHALRAPAPAAATNSASRERLLLRRALHLDDAARTGQDEIGVGLGVELLGIIEIEHGAAADQMPQEIAAT